MLTCSPPVGELRAVLVVTEADCAESTSRFPPLIRGRLEDTAPSLSLQAGDFQPGTRSCFFLFPSDSSHHSFILWRFNAGFSRMFSFFLWPKPTVCYTACHENIPRFSRTLPYVRLSSEPKALFFFPPFVSQTRDFYSGLSFGMRDVL